MPFGFQRKKADVLSHWLTVRNGFLIAVWRSGSLANRSALISLESDFGEGPSAVGQAGKLVLGTRPLPPRRHFLPRKVHF